MAKITIGDLREAFGYFDQRYFHEDRHPKFLAAARRRAMAQRQAATLEVRASDPDNVLGIGIGPKLVKGIVTDTLAARIYVRKKFPKENIPRKFLLPASVDQVPTDVIAVGAIRARQSPARCSVKRQRFQARPAPAGISIGHFRVTAGTLGCLVRNRDGDDFILSNNHVLADENKAEVGDVILQPGRADGGRRSNQRHRIGTLARFINLDLNGKANAVDAAIGAVQPNAVRREICTLGPVAGTGRLRRNLLVQKHGRTTGHTVGIIRDVDSKVWVEYDNGTGLFTQQVEIEGGEEAFSDGGDSGSLILDMERRAVALLFAGADDANITWANPIRRVLRALAVRLVVTGS
jgi:hypothetical protein